MSSYILHKMMQWSGRQIIFPFYHAVSDEPLPHIDPLYAVKNIKTFEKDIQFLCKNYKPISLDDLILHVNNEKLIDYPAFFLSFDDGLRSCREVILPILDKYNISAAFFINKSFVNNQNLFYRHKIGLILHHLQKHKVKEFKKEYLLSLNINQENKIDEIANNLGLNFKDFLQSEQPYMTIQEIKDLNNAGHYIGGHSVHHPNYNDISEYCQITETQESVDFVQQTFTLPYRIFAFPFSDQGIRKSFYDNIKDLDLMFSLAGFDLDEIPTNIKRIDMEKTKLNTPNYLIWKYNKYIAKKILGKAVFKHPL